MHFQPEYTYHIYNRSNETAFKTSHKYLFLLKKEHQISVKDIDLKHHCFLKILELVNFDKDNFYEQSCIILGDKDIDKIF